ncbi:hypothetical protein MY04_4803 [Flammeovirga sp. MY04]|uniref:hypothetical protein n=1 Tax=Flammeovirga sp. MY04 TaxID=1191459 RepID=UPI00080615E3|nr:hypothetical protein [Flammeovirga sp. MY04]ANQ49620.1 hypothetical protein MY04_2246 [Flammeovirga sp. MY04]ANQ52138.1 hypothetical protein MY04_4803 [Flammeovirga sp. MY04]
MGYEEDIQNLLRRITERPPVLFPAKVVTVNENNFSVDVLPLHEEVEIPDVRLKASLDTASNYTVVFPKVESIVVVALIGNSQIDAFVTMVNEPEKIKTVIGETTIEVDQNGISFNGGQNGGLMITPTLVNELEKNNKLLDAFLKVLGGAPITEPGNGSPSALQQALNSALSSFELGDFSEVENKKVKH